MGRGGAAVAKPMAPARGGGWAAAMGTQKIASVDEDEDDDEDDDADEDDE